MIQIFKQFSILFCTVQNNEFCFFLQWKFEIENSNDLIMDGLVH